MKRIFIALALLVAMPAIAQTDWKKLNKLLDDGSVKTVYVQAEKVFKQTQNSTELLTAAWYMARAASEYQEDAGDSAKARYRAILPRLDAIDRAVCYAFLNKSDSALLEEELLKRTPSERIKHFLSDARKKGKDDIVLTPTAYDVVMWTLMDDTWDKAPYLQKLVDFHKDDGDEISLALYLEWINNGGYHNRWTKNEIQNLINKFRGTQCPLMARLYHLMAESLGGENRYEEAVRYCDTAIALFPKSTGGANCVNLRNIILAKAIDFDLDYDNCTSYPGKPSLHALRYRNLKRIYFTLYPFYEDDLEWFWKKRLPAPLHQWHLDVEDDGSHLSRTLIVSLPPLEAGHYVLVASADEKFDDGDACLTIDSRDFVLSHYGGDEYQMVDAFTGAPIEGQTVILKGINGALLDTAYTYPDGRFRFRHDNDYSKRSKMYIERNGVEYEISIWLYRSGYAERESLPYARILADRPIYRPGDTVRFAAVLYESDNVDGRVLAGRDITVTLREPHYKKIDTLKLTSDAHGVASGLFVIPANGMSGMWTLIVEGDNIVNMKTERVRNTHSFRVEEYKSPKFMVSLSNASTQSVSPQFGVPYTIRGIAQAYSGANLSGAKVVYEIERSIQWPRWYAAPMIGKGGAFVDSTVTAADGSFEITYTPLPDSTADLTRKPVFRYRVHVTVTDLNGETHEATTTFNVGFSNERLTISSDPSLSTLTFSYTDLNGNPLKGELAVNLERLRMPDPVRFLPNIFFEGNPTVALDREEYYKLFPHYVYSAEESNRDLLQAEWTYELRHSADGNHNSIDLPKKRFCSGIYRIVASAGEAVDTQYVVLVLPDEKKLPTNDLLWADLSSDEVEVGETLTLRYASALDGSRFFYTLVDPNGREVDSRWLTAGRKIRSISIPVDSSLLGSFHIRLVVVRDELRQSREWSVQVPFSHKKLNVDIATFRDKLQPGEQEEWTVKVSPCQPVPLSPSHSATLIMTMFDDALNSYGSRMYWDIAPWRSGSYSSFQWDVDITNRYSRDFTEKFVAVHYNDPETFKYLLVDGYIGNSAFDEEVFGLDEITISAERVPIIEVGTAESGQRMSSEDVVTMKGNAVRKRAGIQTQTMPGNSVDAVVAAVGGIGYSDEDTQEPAQPVQIRTDLSNLAFFVADLHTDSTGTAIYRFRVPELLTRWNVKGLAFTDDLKIGTLDRTLVTQKPLMVQPNIPRFLRHGDSLEMMAKVVNLTDTARLVCVSFSRYNAADGFQLDSTVQWVTVDAKGSAQVTFMISHLRDNLQVCTYQITARTAREHPGLPVLSDGERGQIPVVSNRQAVTVSQPIYINGKGKKTYTFPLSSASSTAEPHLLGAETVENPIWLAVKSMPYIQECENPSTIYLANRFYVNSIAKSILDNFGPQLTIFNLPDTDNTRLKINEDVKRTLLEATPWLRDAEAEVEQRRAIANYFDGNRLAEDFERIQIQLAYRQHVDGGWGWMPESESSLWVTQQVLKKIASTSQNLLSTEKALSYIDREHQRHYEKYIKPYLKKGYEWAPDNIDYLYTRSFYGKGKTEAYRFYYNNALKNYKSYKGLYTQAQLALVFQRHGDRKAARDLIRRIREKSLFNDEMGMYWRDNKSGWWWYERPIETQALLIQAFSEVTPNDTLSIALMQQWLLKQKQTNHWGNDQATVDAIKALMGESTKDSRSVPQSSTHPVSLKVCGVELCAPSEGLEEYRSQRWAGPALDSIIALGDSTITIRKDTPGIAWGAVYYQYTDDMDKIPSSESGITLKRGYFNQNNQPIQDNQNTPKVGDRVRVRIEISCDRTMEYLELVDGRPSCFEPVSTRSGWNWSTGVGLANNRSHAPWRTLGYYVEVKNTATHCYINRLEKGKYVVEYDVFVTNPGTFLSGPVTMQCMYAPEFRATAPAVRLSVK